MFSNIAGIIEANPSQELNEYYAEVIKIGKKLKN